MVTKKQRATLKIITENPRIPLGKAMIKGGYSPATSTKPKDMTTTKGWKELMDKYFPDKDIVRAVKGLIKARKQIRYYDKEGNFKNMRTIPNSLAVSKGVDFACKLKSKYAPIDVNLNDNRLTKESLDRIIED